jgi:alpha-galactosidase
LHSQTLIENNLLSVSKENPSSFFTYFLKADKKSIDIHAPALEINGQLYHLQIKEWKLAEAPQKLVNHATEYVLLGATNMNSIYLKLIVRVADDNPIIKYRYEIYSKNVLHLTKKQGNDNIQYAGISLGGFNEIKEIGISDFNEQIHATHLTETKVTDAMFNDSLSLMGPIVTAGDGHNQILFAYEHGSQYPNKFLEYKLHPDKEISLHAYKANYLDSQIISDQHPFKTVWFELGAVSGNEEMMAAAYRSFILKYISEYNASRYPYIFYNTWGRQEKIKYRGGTYLQSMNLDYTLHEIDVAHNMGIDVYVIDAGWFKRTGDWKVNTDFFPDTLLKIKERLTRYGMKLGLWLNPTVAAINSNMLKKNVNNRVEIEGKLPKAHDIWDTEASVDMCLVSDYWKDFANELERLIRETGVSYFKWDAISQYSCTSAKHDHGGKNNAEKERYERYAFLLPDYMGKIMDQVHKKYPEVIFDFDITEDGRSVGLEPLSQGKYFIFNNGPYYHNFDISRPWTSPTPDKNPNIFVNAGPARGWWLRSILGYDKWIPSTLFLSHYLPYEPKSSQLQNLASLMLGQNGIWGELDSLQEQDIKLFRHHLDLYKKLRNDITLSTMVSVGEPGDSHEVYEKINKETGKGVVVIFANHKGEYAYVTTAKIDDRMIVPEDVEVKKDKTGAGVIHIKAEESKAYIIYFGVDSK